MMECEIKAISAEKTHAVRHPVLRQGRPMESCLFSGDNKLTTIHLGAYIDSALVGVLSAYQNDHPHLKAKKSHQIRGVAVLEKFHRQGIGQRLMLHIETHLQQNGVDLIWLNARETALAFYTSLAYTQTGTAFDIAEIGKHYCFYKMIQ